MKWIPFHIGTKKLKTNKDMIIMPMHLIHDYIEKKRKLEEARDERNKRKKDLQTFYSRKAVRIIDGVMIEVPRAREETMKDYHDIWIERSLSYYGYPVENCTHALASAEQAINHWLRQNPISFRGILPPGRLGEIEEVIANKDLPQSIRKRAEKWLNLHQKAERALERERQAVERRKERKEQNALLTFKTIEKYYSGQNQI